MEKTIKYLENNGFLKRLKLSTKTTEMLFEMMTDKKVPEEAIKKSCRDLIMREMVRDKNLLDAILDDITDEIIKNI